MHGAISRGSLDLISCFYYIQNNSRENIQICKRHICSSSTIFAPDVQKENRRYEENAHNHHRNWATTRNTKQLFEIARTNLCSLASEQRQETAGNAPFISLLPHTPSVSLPVYLTQLCPQVVCLLSSKAKPNSGGDVQLNGEREAHVAIAYLLARLIETSLLRLQSPNKALVPRLIVHGVHIEQSFYTVECKLRI